MIGILLELFNVDAAYDDYRDTLVRRAQGQTKRLDALQEEATVLSPKREVKALREMLDEVKTARDKANLEVADLRVELGKAKTTAAERFESIEKLEGEVARGYEHQQHLARDLAAARTRVADLECLLRGHCESIDDLRTKLAASQESDTLARDVLSRIGHDLGLARGTDAVKVANAVEDALRLRDSSIGELRAQLDEALAPTAPCFTRGDKVKVIGAVAHIGAAAIEWQRSMLDKVGTVLELCLDGTVRVEFASEGAAWFPVATLELVEVAASQAPEVLPRVVKWADLKPGDLALDHPGSRSFLHVRQSGRAQWRSTEDGRLMGCHTRSEKVAYPLDTIADPDNIAGAWTPQCILLAHGVKANAKAVLAAYESVKAAASLLAEKMRSEA